MISFDKQFESHKDFRDYLHFCVRQEIHGPIKEDAEEFRSQVLGARPAQNYTTGLLFPKDYMSDVQLDNQGNVIDSGDETKEHDPDTNVTIASVKTNSYKKEGVEGNEAADDINLANQHQPSSLGISFSCEKDDVLEVNVYFAKYKHIPPNENAVYDSYSRMEIDKDFTFDLGAIDFHESRDLDGQAKLRIKRRLSAGNFNFVTVWLINDTTKAEKGALDEKIIFQPKITVKSTKSAFKAIEAIAKANQDDDTKSNNLLYRSKKAYSRGHGCAGDWEISEDGNCGSVFSNLFPEFEVKPIIPASLTDTKEPISLSFLENSCLDEPVDQAREKIINNLKRFHSEYKSWILKLEQEAEKLEDHLKSTALEHIKNCNEASDRILSGINLLANDEKALFSFRLANYAMLLQQISGSLKSRKIEENIYLPEDLINENKDRKWFPFQLAFILLSLDGVPISDTHNINSQKLVDLIWFPTGGGKTEAYLGVAAFTIIYSRLKNSEFTGTEVIMRYTLRLLTAQQFQRASCLILALEYMRNKGFFKDENITKSEKRFSSGLWVGQSLTPNTLKEAKDTWAELKSKRGPNKFAILECPWCKTSLEEDYSGYFATTKTFKFRCREKTCHFHREIPINVVDEELYANPPTLLLGTVDKFAQISWRDEPAEFLGRSSGKPPALIIQDELHLISGPLGSVVGHYEVLLRMALKRFGPLPKVIASTATIRRSREQVFGLYGQDVKTFPPQGLDYSDSYFAIEAKDLSINPGRKYVGIFSAGTKSGITAQVHLLAPLIQFPPTFFKKFLPELGEDEKDNRRLPEDVENEYINPYGTIVWYFNTLRELGYADNLKSDQIARQIKNICRRYEVPFPLRKITINSKEMTSRARENEIAEILKDLDINWKPQRFHPSIDILSATNMISVGVDINRLGLMVITGQPKNTSEYIQASSRVGRKFPGLVFTLYNHTRSRDRSHFETFKSYHQTIYKHVEPTSITPFSFKSRERSLPALVIGLARICCDMKDPLQILEKKDVLMERLDEYFQILKDYGLSEDEFSDAFKQVENIIFKWEIICNKASEEDEKVGWRQGYGSNVFKYYILQEYGRTTDDEEVVIDPIEMLTSMRNVDAESTFNVAS